MADYFEEARQTVTTMAVTAADTTPETTALVAPSTEGSAIMAYPPGVSLATITIGAGRTMFGAAPKLISATVTPIFVGTPHVVHAASGWPFYPTPRTFRVENGEELTFELPHVNAEGWRDTAGNEFPALLDSGERDRGWAYHAKFTVIGGSGQDSMPHRYEKVFQPLVGQTEPLDVDLVPDGQIGAPVSAPTAVVTSVNGQTGPIDLDGVYLTAEDGAALADASGDQAVIDAGTYTDQQIGSAVTDAKSHADTLDAENRSDWGTAVTEAESAGRLFTVAAVDTHPLLGAGASYVCDGVDDLATIQAALDALPDSATVSGEVVVLPGTYTDASGMTVSISSPTDGSRNVKKVLRFQRGARLNVSGRTGRRAVFKIESSFCQIINPEIAGPTPRLVGSGTAIAFGGPASVLGGRYSRAAYFSSVHEPVIRNFETGVEFGSVDGVASTGDCYGMGGMIENCVSGVRAAGYVNRWYSLGATYCDRNIWVESRRVEAQLDVFGSTLTNWYEAAIVVDGGAGSHFHDTWMEHTLSTAAAQEAVRIGLSNATRASLVRFSGKTLAQLNTESYVFRLVGSAGLTVEDLQVSTSGITPSVSIIRNETSVSSKANRFQRITFGPSTTPAHTLITGTGTGQVYVDRTPVAGAIEYSNKRNSETSTQEHPFIVKAADETYLGNANLHNDTELVVTAQGGNSVYLLTGFIRYEADAAADIKGTVQVPAGGALQWQGLGAVAGSTSAETSINVGTYAHNVEIVYGGAGAGVPLGVRLSGYLTTGTTGGTVRWRWAQGTANGTVPTKVLAGSWLKLEKID